MTDETQTTPDIETLSQKYGQPVKVLKNGAIYGLGVGKIVGNPPGGPTTAITQSKTDEFHELSRQARLDAVYRGLAKGTGRANAHAAVEAIVARQSELALSIERGRASTEAARFTFQAGDLLPERRLVDPGGASLRIDVGQDALLALLQAVTGRLEQLEGGEVIDVEGNGED